MNRKCVKVSLLDFIYGFDRNTFSFVRSPSLFYLLTVGVEVVYFHLITLKHTTVGRTPLGEGSARLRDLYPTTQTLTQEKKINAPGGIRTQDPSKRLPADLRLRPRGHWDRPDAFQLTQLFWGFHEVC
jgi:hypothetical protein